MILSLVGVALATHVTTFDIDPLYTKSPISGLEGLVVEPAAVQAQLKPLAGADLPTAERGRNEAKPRERALAFTNPGNNWAEVSINGLNLGIVGPYATMKLEGLKSGNYHVNLKYPTGYVRDFVVQVGFVPPAARPVAIEVREDRLQLSDKVWFDFDSAEILPGSHALLDGVAKSLAEHPEILEVRVEGHTDVQGDADYNQKLSQARAEAVRAYIVGKGVDAARVVAVGLGETQPVDPADTDAAHEANRRIEFRIAKREAPPEPAAEPKKLKGKKK